MSIARALKKRLQAAAPPVFFLALAGYFVWGATQGERGLMAYDQRRALLHQAKDDLARAEAERDAMERRVAGLRAQHLDRDTLDERSRAMLNLSDPTDVIVPYPPKGRLF